MATPEKKVKTKVVKILKEAGAWYFFPPSSRGLGRAGVPDVIFCLRGVFGGIECKAGNNTLTKLQAKELNDITRAGGWTMVINEDPEGFEALRGWCETINHYADQRRAESEQMRKQLVSAGVEEALAEEAINEEFYGKQTGDASNDTSQDTGAGQRDPAD